MKAGTASSTLQVQRTLSTLSLVVDKTRLKAQGDRIRELRKLAHVSQETVAREVGVTMRGYQAWERGESEIRYENLVRLADYLKVTPDFIEYGRPKARGETPDMAKTLDIGAEILARMGEVMARIEDLETLNQRIQQRQENLFVLLEQLVADQIRLAATINMLQDSERPPSRRRRSAS